MDNALEMAYREWADTAEREISDITGVTLPVYSRSGKTRSWCGDRCCPPTRRMRARHDYFRTQLREACCGWRWLVHHAEELLQLRLSRPRP